MKDSEILESNGFKNQFPFVDYFRKDISETSAIIIHSCYRLHKNDVVEDDRSGVFFFKTIKLNLPKKEIKIFKNISNVISYCNEN